MPTVEITEHIEATPQDVWDFISDIHRGPEWVTVMKEVLYLSDEQLTEGSIYRERSQVGPITSETEWHITTFDPPRVQVHECTEAAMRAVLMMQVEPEATGAQLVHRTQYQMLPGLRPLGWVVEKLFAEKGMERELRQTVANAKRMLENQ